jgi:hypothetical protein
MIPDETERWAREDRQETSQKPKQNQESTHYQSGIIEHPSSLGGYSRYASWERSGGLQEFRTYPFSNLPFNRTNSSLRDVSSL